MKKWLPAIFILAAALIFFGVISLPIPGCRTAGRKPCNGMRATGR